MDDGLFLSIAEIAGIFVGFGALISFSHAGPVAERAPLRTVVTIGLVVLVAALLPVGLARYGLADRALWGASSAAFMIVIWISLVALLRDPEYRAWLRSESRPRHFPEKILPLLLELAIQLPLLLAIFGVAPALAPAFYVTALVMNLFEAALVLARLVFAERGPR